MRAFYSILITLSILINITYGIEMFVDADTGEFTSIRPTNVGLWPDELGECTESVDALYIEHSDRYQVYDWIFSEIIYPSKGAFANKITIYDTIQFVIIAHAVGVWQSINNCNEITAVMKTTMLLPLIEGMETPAGEELTARSNGLVVEFKCKDAIQLQSGDEYHTCTGNELHSITKTSEDTIHQRRVKL